MMKTRSMERASMTYPQPPGQLAKTVIASALSVVALVGCQAQERPTDTAGLEEFATSYTTAWCSREPELVAAHFAENGSLTINGGVPSVGRAAITAAAADFMTALPDMVVVMDEVSQNGVRAVYRWTLTGTNTGPGGTGNAIHISGYEEWTLSSEGLIAESKGHFDAAEYERQLNGETGAG
jgi:hypothetical protein